MIDAELPEVSIANLGPGPARITGRVVAGTSGMQAPLSGRWCVFYQVRGKNHLRPWHDIIYYPPQDARFEIEDDTGRISSNVVALAFAGRPTRDGPGIEPFCVISGEPFRRVIYDGESAELDRLLDPGGFPFVRETYLDAEERIIAGGDRVTAVGEIVQEITPDGSVQNYRTPPMTLAFWVQKIRK